ncbi:MAG: hypothetical protein KGN79_14665 [Acidobacteriota bacterium]|nr:hypothetical protein [Acidobacteriota bacterium]
MAFSATSTFAVRSALPNAALHLASTVNQSRVATFQTAAASVKGANTSAMITRSAQRLAYFQALQAALSPAQASLLRLDLTALGAAIHSGNLPSAQTAYITFKGNLRDIPQQQLDYSNSGLSQTATRADVRIALLNSISQAVRKAATQLKQGAASATAANVGSIIDTYV